MLIIKYDIYISNWDACDFHGLTWKIYNMKLDNVPVIIYWFKKGLKDEFDKGMPLNFRDWVPNWNETNCIEF